MKYTDLIATLAERARFRQKDVKELLEVMAEVLSSELKAGDKVWTPFGTFKSKHITPQPRRMPDGTPVMTHEKVAITLKPGKSMNIRPGERTFDYLVAPSVTRSDSSSENS
jgi:nucleoid DNA-binding protein